MKTLDLPLLLYIDGQAVGEVTNLEVQADNILEAKIQEAKEVVMRSLETSEFTRVHVYCSNPWWLAITKQARKKKHHERMRYLKRCGAR